MDTINDRETVITPDLTKNIESPGSLPVDHTDTGNFARDVMESDKAGGGYDLVGGMLALAQTQNEEKPELIIEEVAQEELNTVPQVI